METPKKNVIIIDGQEIEIENGETIYSAAARLNKEIPVFCYHPKLSIAGNCRMCLVEVEGMPKAVASCSYPASAGMKVKTRGGFVDEARKHVMEFLLANHPLDCPICDQGGECDLQDLSYKYGQDRSRLGEVKRSVNDKDFGPLVKTSMNRCIQCGRCVRFMQEIAGTGELGLYDRGTHMEIDSEGILKSELSGNIIDICPVGALTSKPSAFQARGWELQHTYAIDVMDAVGSRIRVDTKADKIIRILPSAYEPVNEDWISDKTRFAFDGLKYQRIDVPYIRKNGILVPASFEEAIEKVVAKLQESPESTAGLVGPLMDAESICMFKYLMHHLNIKIDSRPKNSILNEKMKCYTPIARMEETDCVLIIGVNLRAEAPLIHARLQKASLKRDLKAFNIGKSWKPTFPCEYLGDNLEIFENFGSIKEAFKNAKNPLIMVGASILQRKDAKAILNFLYDFGLEVGLQKEEWNGFNIIHEDAGQMAALKLGAISECGTEKILQESNVFYLLGCDIPFEKREGCFVIYQGHHADAGAEIADIVLPGAAYLEKSGKYMNMEGRIQQSYQAVLPPGNAKQDCEILKRIGIYFGLFENINSYEDAADFLCQIDSDFLNEEPQKKGFVNLGAKGEIDYKLEIKDENKSKYMGNVISRNSPTMAKCARSLEC